MTHAIFTICSRNYLGQATTLMRSVAEYEPDAARHDLETSAALGDLIALSRELARLEQFTGRTEPSVIT